MARMLKLNTTSVLFRSDRAIFVRNLHTSLPFQKRNSQNSHGKHIKNNKKNKGEDEEVTIVDVNQYLTNAREKFDQTLKYHQDKLNKTKQGIADTKIFDSLRLINNSKFTDVATTSMKGKNMLLVTVFNPNDVKNVISCILGSGLNLTPERMSGDHNEQMLKVMLPPLTKDSRMQQVKELKKVFETYKNSNSSFSLSSIRRDNMNKLKKLKQDDLVRKASKDLENIHKDYVSKLQEQLKKVENSILNQ